MDYASRYRDNQLSSDEDSEDSDKECNVWKRASTIKRKAEDENVSSIQNEQLSEISTNPKRKRNTIWTEVLQDQLISQDLEGCLLKNKPAHYGSRGAESYDYTLKYKDPRLLNDSEYPMEEDHCDKEESTYSYNKTKVKKFVKLDGAELSAARKITKVLNEKKVYLIQRIVKFVGIEKAMTLLNMTEEIEENGGMMIKNNARRRTPGGVYLQLLKSDKDVTQQMLDKIFEGEMSCMELKKHFAEKKKKKNKFSKGQKDKKSKEIKEAEKIEPPNITMDDDDDDEINSITKFKNSSLENNLVFLSNSKISSNNDSDLEEGEIED